MDQQLTPEETQELEKLASTAKERVSNNTYLTIAVAVVSFLLTLTVTGEFGAEGVGMALVMGFGIGILVAFTIPGPYGLMKAYKRDLEAGMKKVETGPIQRKTEYHGKYAANYAIYVNHWEIPTDITTYVNCLEGDVFEVHFAPESMHIFTTLKLSQS